jgi:hypothetical protein
MSSHKNKPIIYKALRDRMKENNLNIQKLREITGFSGKRIHRAINHFSEIDIEVFFCINDKIFMQEV